MLDFGCWMLVGECRRRLRPSADAWVGRWVGGWRLYVVGFATGQVGDLPHGLFWGCLANRSQIGLPLFAETLEFVEGTVKGPLQAAFLAVEQAQRGFAPSDCVPHATSIIKIAILLDGRQTLQLVGVEAGFLMVEASESPIRQG
jgi:hypothetical protein